MEHPQPTCAATDNGAHCAAPAAITAPVPLCETHHHRIAISGAADFICNGVRRLINRAMGVHTAGETTPHEPDVVPEQRTEYTRDEAAAAEREEAREALHETIRLIHREGAEQIGPRDVLLRNTVNRSRSWISSEMLKLAEEGILLKTGTAGVYGFGRHFAGTP